VLVAAATLGCDAEPRVAVEARIDDRPVAELPVRLLPYDREAILDSLAAAADTPEPLPRPGLIEALRSIEAGQIPVNLPGDTTAPSPAEQVRRLRAEADSVRQAQRVWADQVFGPLEGIADRQREASRREELADTTDAAGRVEFRAPEGGWWVNARYRLPYSELRWSVPVRVVGDSARVVLSRENAVDHPRP
jgi:hypothetical protein